MDTLIAEDLLLLLLDDARGTMATSYPQPVLGGALLIELAVLGAVEVEEKTSMWRSAKVRAVEGAEIDDAILRAAYAEVGFRDRSAQSLVDKLGKGARDQLGERLVDRGVLELHEGRFLLVFPRRRWVTIDSTHEAGVRRELQAVLVEGREPTDRTGALVALLQAVDRAHKVVDHRGVGARAVKKRAKQISEGAWAAKAVRDAIQAANAAVSAGAVAGAAGSSSG